VAERGWVARTVFEKQGVTAENQKTHKRERRRKGTTEEERVTYHYARGMRGLGNEKNCIGAITQGRFFWGTFKEIREGGRGVTE